MLMQQPQRTPAGLVGNRELVQIGDEAGLQIVIRYGGLTTDIQPRQCCCSLGRCCCESPNPQMSVEDKL